MMTLSNGWYTVEIIINHGDQTLRWQIRETEKQFVAQHSQYKATVEWQSRERDRRQLARRRWVSEQWVLTAPKGAAD